MNLISDTHDTTRGRSKIKGLLFAIETRGKPPFNRLIAKTIPKLLSAAH
jgi:hypothetical protein